MKLGPQPVPIRQCEPTGRVGWSVDLSWDGVIDALGGPWTEEWDNADGSERSIQRQQTIPKSIG